MNVFTMMIVLIYSFTIKGTNFLNKHQLKYFCTLFVTFKGLKGNQIFSVKLYFYIIFHMIATHKKTKHEWYGIGGNDIDANNVKKNDHLRHTCGVVNNNHKARW